MVGRGGSRPLNRRALLRSIGAGALASTITGGFDAGAPRFDVVGLADAGLAEGDLIDPYLDRYFVDGTVVCIPRGFYRWEGGGLGEVSDAYLLGKGRVYLETPLGTSVNANLVATGGTVVVKNVTQVGPVDSGNNSRIATWATAGATLSLEEFNRPDGQTGDGSGGPIGFFVPPKHAGTVVFRNCTVAGFGNNGLYASSPKKGRNGRVVVEGGLYANNNVASIRIGSDESVVRNATIVHDGEIPPGPGGKRNGRGLWVRHDGEDIVVENCDVTFSGGQASTLPVGIFPRNGGGSGTVRNCRIRNDTDNLPIRIAEDVIDRWSGDGIHLTGDGNLSREAAFADWIDCAGEECARPIRRKQLVGGRTSGWRTQQYTSLCRTWTDPYRNG